MPFEIANQHSIIIATIFIVAIIGYLLKKIDLKGAITGSILAIVIFFGAGPEGILALFLFFTFGSFVSSWKNKKKIKLNLAQENAGIRGVSNVLANGGIAAALAVMSIYCPFYINEMKLMIVAAFATACSDTLSSEMGNIYGKKYFNIISLKPAERGKDGVISINGLWFGFLGSFAIALCTFPFQHDFTLVVVITFAGLLGNIFDSILGATIQYRGYINNHQVNFLATAFGAGVALVIYVW